MQKVIKILLSVLLVVVILAACILFSPFIPLKNDPNCLVSPMDLLLHPEQAEGTHHTPQDPFSLRAEISTIEEAISYLEQKHGTVYMMCHIRDDGDPLNYWYLFSGKESLELPPDNGMARDNIVQTVTYLLSDDMDICSIMGFGHDKNGGMPTKAINCIKTNSGYQFIDPVLLMFEEPFSRYGTMLPEATVGSLEEYVNLCKSIPGISWYVDYLYLFSDSERIEVVEDDRGIATLVPRDNSQLLWDNTAKNDLTYAQYLQLQTSYVDPQYISNYDLYSCLGGITLTPEEARALVDAEPEIVKEQVRTAADVLMYMLAANIQPGNGCYHDNWDGDIWHTNMNARQVMQSKLAVCGSCANLANYLLEGDYEEVGFMDHVFYPGGGGSHVYNYIVYEGKYFIVDFSHYMFNYYTENMISPILVLDSLEELGDRIRQGHYSWFYGNICIITAYTSPGQQLPCIFGDDNCYYFPEGAEYTVIYETGEGFTLAEKPFNKDYYDWNLFWEEEDRDPTPPDPNNDLRFSEDGQTAVSVTSNPEDTDQFQLSQLLGGTTLTPEEAYALVDADPEVVKEAVKTAPDLLMYALAAQIGDCGGCYCDQWGEYVWHSNYTAKEVMAKKLANCGAFANLANYLLEGDYEEVGIIQQGYYAGNGGGHVYNYFLHAGKYYIVDYSWYMFANYAPSNDFPVMILDSLEDYTGELAKQLYPNVSLVIALTSTGQHLPNIFGEDYNEDPYYYYVPEGAEYTVLFEAGDGYLIGEKPLNKKYHDWTEFWPGYAAP